MYKIEKSEAEILRQRAEALLKEGPSQFGMQLSEGETLKLFHELEVHQIEIELQNEELLLARSASMDASLKYLELNDLHQRVILHFVKKLRNEVL